MDLQLFIEKGLASHFYFSKSSLYGNLVKVKKLCIFFPGLPNVIDKDFFVNRVNKDVAFLSINFIGSWLSSGTFSPENCRRTVNLAIDFANRCSAKSCFDQSQIKWQFDDLYVACYSFGANSILTSNVSNKIIKAVLLYSPLIFLNKVEIEKAVSTEEEKNFYLQNKNFLQFLKCGYSEVLRGIQDVAWEKYYLGNEPSSIVQLKADFPFSYVFHGKSDNLLSPKFSEYFCKSNPEKSRLFLFEGGHTKDTFNTEHLI